MDQQLSLAARQLEAVDAAGQIRRAVLQGARVWCGEIAAAGLRFVQLLRQERVGVSGNQRSHAAWKTESKLEIKGKLLAFFQFNKVTPLVQLLLAYF